MKRVEKGCKVTKGYKKYIKKLQKVTNSFERSTKYIEVQVAKIHKRSQKVTKGRKMSRKVPKVRKGHEKLQKVTLY